MSPTKRELEERITTLKDVLEEARELIDETLSGEGEEDDSSDSAEDE